MKFLQSLVLFCRDTDISKEWYTRVGFGYLRGHEGMHWFKAGEVEIMLHPTDRKGNSGDAQFFVEVDDIYLFFQQVKEAGFQPIDYYKMEDASEPVPRTWGTDFGLVDPDGYLWAFTCHRLRGQAIFERS